MKRFEAAGWAATRVDGHDPEAIARALEKARTAGKPSLIACKTTIGYGAPTKAGTSGSHGSPLGPDEIAGARKALGWDYPRLFEHFEGLGKQVVKLRPELSDTYFNLAILHLEVALARVDLLERPATVGSTLRFDHAVVSAGPRRAVLVSRSRVPSGNV